MSMDIEQFRKIEGAGERPGSGEVIVEVRL